MSKIPSIDPRRKRSDSRKSEDAGNEGNLPEVSLFLYRGSPARATPTASCPEGTACSGLDFPMLGVDARRKRGASESCGEVAEKAQPKTDVLNASKILVLKPTWFPRLPSTAPATQSPDEPKNPQAPAARVHGRRYPSTSTPNELSSSQRFLICPSALATARHQDDTLPASERCRKLNLIDADGGWSGHTAQRRAVFIILYGASLIVTMHIVVGPIHARPQDGHAGSAACQQDLSTCICSLVLHNVGVLLADHSLAPHRGDVPMAARELCSPIERLSSAV
ncbi:hypothetical protein K438DRAFT_1945466 [Mycena galopus ATCC 62051]|nr:hypothetical protein K438DRAFT_1945466 [Mycena galopus ATCC 62051]